MSDPSNEPTQHHQYGQQQPPHAQPVSSGGPGWGQQPGHAPMQTAYSTETMLADKAAQMSLIFGIVGLFFAGIIFGPLAIWQAGKAEKLNKSATPGKVLGWIDLLWGIAQLVIFFSIVGALMASA